MKETKNPNIYNKADLTYNDYLKIPEILKLQKPLATPPQHDEMLFIVIHQAYELWFKLVLFELEHSAQFLEKNEILRARHFVSRCVEVMKVLVKQIHLLETMQPVEFLKFRDVLNPASGFQSMQFREVEFFLGLKDERYLKHFEKREDLFQILKKRLEAKDLKQYFYDLLLSLGLKVPKDASLIQKDEAEKEKAIQALLPIYQSPEENMPLYLLCESFLDLDHQLILWREHHVGVVERVIGFKHGTGGSSGVQYLKSTLSKQAFPELWQLRTSLKLS